MIRLAFYVVLVGSFLNSYAQRKSNAQQIDPAQIPSAVKTSQASAFPNAAVAQWEIRNLSGNKKFVSKYIAVFEQEGQSIRARYKGDGTIVSSSVFFDAQNAPDQIKNLAAKYDNHDLKKAERIKTYAKEKTFYRAFFQKGRKTLVVYTDETGKELVSDKVPVEAREDEELKRSSLIPLINP